MEDYIDIKEEIVLLKARMEKLEERRKGIRICPCKEREKGTCNVGVFSYYCPFDEAGIKR